MRRKPAWIGRAGALLAVLCAHGAAAAQPARSWYDMVAAGGERLGYASQEVTARPGGREVIQTMRLRLQELNGAPVVIASRTVTREDAAGRPVSVVHQLRTGRSRSRLEARILADVAEITRHAGSDRRVVRVGLPPGVRFDGGAALLRGWDPRVRPRLAFDNLNVEAMVVEHVVIEPDPSAGEGARAALRRRYVGDELRGVARLRLGPEGRIVAVTQPMFGTAITTRETTRDQALRAHAPYHVLPNALVRSPFRIPPQALNGHIRYRVAFTDGIAFAIPQTAEQRVRAEAGGATIDICGDCGPGLAADPVALADALRPTPWLQSDHPRLRAIAEPVAALAVSPAEKMELLRRRARPILAEIDFTGHFSALETLDRRAGDCTEAAVLLAALGRAAGIPTRVANGLVYSREHYHGVSHVFMPHSWTLAWVGGRWQSFDLALDAFDSSHVALTVGDGDAGSVHAANQLAGLLRWEAMTEVRPRAR